MIWQLMFNAYWAQAILSPVGLVLHGDTGRTNSR